MVIALVFQVPVVFFGSDDKLHQRPTEQALCFLRIRRQRVQQSEQSY